MMKRQTYISWDDYFVGVALLSVLHSKDPHRKSGACIINTAKRIVGIGYNGFPHGCNDMLLSLGERPMMVQWSRQYHGSI